MTSKNPKNSYLDNEDDHALKIFEKSSFRDREQSIKDVETIKLDSNDSDMKIFKRAAEPSRDGIVYLLARSSSI